MTQFPPLICYMSIRPLASHVRVVAQLIWLIGCATPSPSVHIQHEARHGAMTWVYWEETAEDGLGASSLLHLLGQLHGVSSASADPGPRPLLTDGLDPPSAVIRGTVRFPPDSKPSAACRLHSARLCLGVAATEREVGGAIANSLLATNVGQVCQVLNEVGPPSGTASFAPVEIGRKALVRVGAECAASWLNGDQIGVPSGVSPPPSYSDREVDAFGIAITHYRNGADSVGVLGFHAIALSGVWSESAAAKSTRPMESMSIPALQAGLVVSTHCLRNQERTALGSTAGRQLSGPGYEVLHRFMEGMGRGYISPENALSSVGTVAAEQRLGRELQNTYGIFCGQ